MKDTFKIFPKNLKKLRKLSNMKQEELAQKSKIPRSSLSYYETGKSEPSLISLKNIASVFDISIDELVNVELTEEILREKRMNKDVQAKRVFISTTIFSKNLKKLRLERKMNQKELAEKIGISESSVSVYESGLRDPILSSLLKISEFFSISIDRLASEDINIIQFTEDEIDFFKRVNFDFKDLNSDNDFLTLLYNLKKYYLKQSEKLTNIIQIEIPFKIKEIDEIIEFIRNKDDEYNK